MQLSLQNFSSLLQTMAAGVQGAATRLLDLSVGSTLRAILEANASIGLWMQWLIVQVLGVTRAATSTGADLDSFVNDFGLIRLPAQTANGMLTLSRYTATLAAFVPVAAQVRSSDGSQSFAIAAAPANAAWIAALNGYSVAAGVGSITVPANAVTPGAAGNIQAGTATVLGTAIAGVDTVTNPGPFANGLDAEPDAALRVRFANYIQSRTRGTRLAVASAIDGVRVGLSYTIAENMDAGGNSVAGSFLVTVDDGSGAPPAALLASCAAAVDAVRPVGTVFTLRAPTIWSASITLTLGVTDSTRRPDAVAAVTAALSAYVNALPVGAALYWSRLAQIAYDASPLVSNVSGLILNGGPNDLLVPAYAVAKIGTLSVS